MILKHIKKIKKFFTRKIIIVGLIVLFLASGSFYLFNFATAHKKIIALKSLSLVNGFSDFLFIPADEKKELDVINTLAQNFFKKDGKIFF